MSERNTRPTLGDHVGWNTGGTGTETDPTAERTAGWANAQTPGHDEDNYMYARWGEMIQWLEKYAAREWRDIIEATPTDSGMLVGELLAIVPQSGGASARGSAVFSGATSVATGGGNIYRLCTDGEYGYYVSGGGGASKTRIVKFDPSDGSLVLQAEAYSGNAISALAVDGAAVFTMGSNAADTGLTRWTRSALASEANAGSEYACVQLAANGYYAAGVAPNSGGGKVVVYTDINGHTIVEGTPYNTGGSLTAVAIDCDRCYVGGTRSTYDVWAVTLSTSGLSWRTTLPTSSAPTVSGIAADGDRVYVATDRVALTAGGNANLHCLERETGNVLWSADVGSTSDLSGLSIDDEMLYAADGTTCYMLSKSYPPAVAEQSATNGLAYGNTSDGVGVLLYDSPISSFSRYWTHPARRRVFRVADTEDPNRVPFHHIVVPG